MKNFSFNTWLHALFVVFTLSCISVALWAVFNRPESQPNWPSMVGGYAFSPYQRGQNPVLNEQPTLEQIESDIALLATQTKRLRTYSTQATLAQIPAIAAKYDMEVTVGAWLSDDVKANAVEVERVIDIANNNPNVKRIIVGNEVLLRENLTAPELIRYIRLVKSAVSVPVSTAEPEYIWNANPALGKTVDFVTVHALPYWQGLGLEDAIGDVQNTLSNLAQANPNKPILLGEVGWPSRGRSRGFADATVMDQAKFLRKFLNIAEAKHLDYFIMEAFDQPWKQEMEGTVGAYWGVYNVDREAKFPFTGPLVEVPHWRELVAISIALAILTFIILMLDGQMLHKRGLSFLALVTFIMVTMLVWMAYDYTDQYATLGTILLGVVLAASVIGISAVLMFEAHEWAEAVWVRNRRRAFLPQLIRDFDYQPKVSIHVPCYNEPPEMVIQTLNSLAALQYDNFEVLIIDNNTKDETVWLPVQAHCLTLGERFRFFHVDPLAGFKAGALNFALRNTAADAEVVAVIDSDYQVDPRWLCDLIPQFKKEKIAVVQAPQDYRDGEENLFKRMCNAEYRGFFHIGMVTRNDRNAIIQHGTMTMVRRTVLEEVGGWGEWCITEDAELGLSIFERGYEAAYFEKSYGKGLIPDNFIDFKKQRFRWAYGAVQILRRHASSLFLGNDTALTAGQRYHFIGGWLPWLADGLNLFFTAGAVLWSCAMIIAPERIDSPLAIFAMPPISLFIFKLLKLFNVYHTRVRVNFKTAVFAAIAGLGLSYTISKAVFYGCVSNKMPFIRTPKLKNKSSLTTAIVLAWEEVSIMVVLWLCIIGVSLQQDTRVIDVRLWLVVLAIQSIPYGAALWLSIVNTWPERKKAQTGITLVEVPVQVLE